MVKINNHIKILFTKYSKDVIIDTIGGELIVYNHSDLCMSGDNMVTPFLGRNFFTGISLDVLPPGVKFVVESIDGIELKSATYKNYLYVEKREEANLAVPIGVVRFVADSKEGFIKSFFAHFIEKIK